eukprot:5017652-Prymnesium_polylepis.2
MSSQRYGSQTLGGLREWSHAGTAARVPSRTPRAMGAVLPNPTVTDRMHLHQIPMIRLCREAHHFIGSQNELSGRNAFECSTSPIAPM